MNQQLNDRDELDRFKREVSIADFSTLYGWTVDSKESNRTVNVLRRQHDHGKLLVKAGPSGWDIYLDCRSGQQGTVVDFVQTEERCRLGGARTILRRWIGSDPPRRVASLTGSPTRSDGHSDEPDRKRVAAVWAAAVWEAAPDYLKRRGLATSLALQDERFAGTYRTNRHGVVMFPHRDRGGLSGYELRGIDANGDKLKAFAKGGKRGLWYSRNVANASTIIVCESAIDALSHCELYPSWNAGYVSFAGDISTRQKSLLAGLFEKADSRHARLVIATDNDDAGDKHFKTCAELTKARLFRLRPIGKDWNDDLQFVKREDAFLPSSP